MKKIGIVVAGLSVLLAAHAELTVLVAIEPTSRKDGLMVSRVGLESGLAKLLNQSVQASTTEDLTDALRATRSKGYDVFIAPAQVAASALGHGYELLGATEPEEQYLLVGRTGVAAVGGLRKGRLYLPQQDSIHTYLARGLLTSAGLSFRDLGKVDHAIYPQAGLTALSLHLTDATVVRREDWEPWLKDNPNVATVLATSGPVPGGLSVVVKKGLPADDKALLTKWFGSASRSAGLKPAAQHFELQSYRKLAELGSFTPSNLPGVAQVGVTEVNRLMGQGALVVDTRNEQEFKTRHIPGAVFVPYHEKSLKDVAYDSSLDDFKGLAKLDPKRPTIFHCNGPECWKSYKASKAALAAGFTKIYWYRGGMPDWETAGQATASGSGP